MLIKVLANVNNRCFICVFVYIQLEDYAYMHVHIPSFFIFIFIISFLMKTSFHEKNWNFPKSSKSLFPLVLTLWYKLNFILIVIAFLYQIILQIKFWKFKLVIHEESFSRLVALYKLSGIVSVNTLLNQEQPSHLIMKY